MGIVLKCDWLALTACYCFNSVNRLLVFHFPNRPLSYCHDHNDILWNDKTFSGFFSGKTDSSQAETFHNKPLKELEGCVAFVKLSCSSSLVCQLEYVLDFLVCLVLEK